MRQAKSLLVDLSLIGLSILLALFLRDDLTFDNEHAQLVLPYLAISLLVALVVFPAAGVSNTL